MQNDGAIISFEEMDALLDEALEFFESIPEYQGNEGGLTEMLIPCIMANQYVMRRDEAGKIACFITYWKTDERGYEDLKTGTHPKEKFKGNIIYGVDCASTLTKKQTYEALNEIRTRHKYSILCFDNQGKFKQFQGVHHGS